MSRRASRNSASFVEAAHQSALAAAAFEDLRLEHESRPVAALVGRVFAGAQQHAARHGKAVAAQQGFSVGLGKTHNGLPSAVRRIFPGAYRMSGQLMPANCACRFSIPSRGGSR